MKKILGVIPARLQSTRLPEKMLANVGSKPLILHTIDRAREARLIDEIIVATDSVAIAETVRTTGVQVLMTSPHHKSGSDRVAEAVRKFKEFKPIAIVNIQGDEPVIDPAAIDVVARLLLQSPQIPMSTVATYFHSNEEVKKPNHVKVVLDRYGNALYFSRSMLPFPRNEHSAYYKHIGIFGFQPDFLMKYVRLRQTPLERAESLEQLRALENGYKIQVGIGDFTHISVDVPRDLARVRRLFSQKRKRSK